MPRGPSTSRRVLAAVVLAVLLSAAYAPQGAAAPGPPRSVRVPRVMGHPVQAATLRAGRGTWSGAPQTFRFAWLACEAAGRRCRARGAAHGARYRLAAADVGHRMRVRVTAVRRRGGRTLSSSARSAPTAPVRASAIDPVVLAALVPGLGELIAETLSPASLAPPAKDPPGKPTSELVPMPVISRGVPAFASDDCGNARAANDATYGTRWDCPSAPSAAAPDWLAYDLSGVPAGHRTRVVVAWFNDPITSEFDHTGLGPAYNLPRDYALEVNGAPGGGSPPASGWTRPVPAVTGNAFNSRQQVLDMTGANWIRMLVTGADGPSGADHVTLNLDVHDASAGVTDDWIFYGDSITQDGMSHDTRTPAAGPVGTFSQLITASKPAFSPLFQNGGIGGLQSADGAAKLDDWLPLFPGHYVALNYGANDALVASPGDTSIAARFHTNMKAMAEAVISAGKVPIIPMIPWGSNKNVQANVPVLNDEILKLRTELPKLAAGPDLYAYFRDHPSLIGDGIHPTHDEGYAALRRLWADFALSLYP